MKSPNSLQGELDASELRVGIVLSRFNGEIGERLLQGAIEALARHGADTGRIDIVRVPGAFEIPLALKALATSGLYDALVALGAVIRGETPHFEYVSRACTDGVARVSLDHGVPVGFGVLTVNTDAQAEERAGGSFGNKGFEAAEVAIEMASLLQRLRD